MEIDKCLFILISQTGKISDYYNIPEGYRMHLYLHLLRLHGKNVGLFVFNVLPEGKRIQILQKK
jgi:hypothetical protein